MFLEIFLISICFLKFLFLMPCREAFHVMFEVLFWLRYAILSRLFMSLMTTPQNDFPHLKR